MSNGAILVDRRDPATTRLAISNPQKFNAMSLDMWRDLDIAIAHADADPAVRAIVVRGDGARAFASGADISEFPDHRNSHVIARNYDAMAGRALQRLRRSPKPTIAVIEGHCIGGGVLIALACDLRYAGQGARFSIPAARVGLGYDWPATKDLIDACGVQTAKEMLYTARSYAAEEAQANGLVARVLPEAELAAFVDDTVARIVVNAPLTIAAAKDIAAELLKSDGNADLALCDALCARCSDSEDYREGYAAFLEKRPPSFHGR